MKRLSREDDILRASLWGEGYNDGQIAKILGCAHNTIALWRRTRGIPSNAKNQRISNNMQMAVYLLNKWEFNNREISSITGLSLSSVRKILKKFGREAVGHTVCSIMKLLDKQYPLTAEDIELLEEGVSPDADPDERKEKIRRLLSIQRRKQLFIDEYEDYMAYCLDIING